MDCVVSFFVPKGEYLLILFFAFVANSFSQELTEDWNGGGDNWTATACGTDISTNVSNELNGAITTFSGDPIGCNMPNTFSSPAVVGREALAPFLMYGTSGGSGILTFTFSQPVTDPILHIDRLGGGAGTISTSALLTLTTPAITLQRLSGNGPHFEVNGNQITRTPDQTITGVNLECGTPVDGVAAGSIRLVGTFSTASFRFEQNGTGGNADAIEVVWELDCPPPPALDFDNDGIPDPIDLDDDNDGILDTTEQNGIPTLDTDSDGLIDSFDLDSDGDGCNDVIEAGFEDLDTNGTLGSAPDNVDINGLIINAVDGYTTPNDLNTNSIYDFQERSSVAILQNPLDMEVCVGEAVQFQVNIENSNSITWELSNDNGVSWYTVPGDSGYTGMNTETLSISNVTPASNGDLFRARVNALESVCDPFLFSESALLTVFEFAMAGEDVDLVICLDEPTFDLTSALGENIDSGGNWNPTLSSGSNMFNPGVDVAGSYTYAVNNGSCASSSTVNIAILKPPVIESIAIAEMDDGVQITVNTLEQSENEYSIDGLNYQEGNTFGNVEPGNYTLFVQSLNGCGIVSENVEIFSIIDYPKFFTPNDDGINDGWQIEDNGVANAITYIFDRYGKLLKVLVGQNERWDGTYNNRRMPSTDYWFKVVAEDLILQTGHFTLKR